MKELQQLTQDNKEIKAQAPVKKETKQVGKIQLRKGHTCFEINKTTLEVAPAKYDTVVEITKLSPDGARRNKLIVKEGFFYVTALNAHNALKKYISVLHHFVNQKTES